MDVVVYDNYPFPHCPVNQHIYSVSPLDGIGIAQPFYIIIPDGLRPHYESGKVVLTFPCGITQTLESVLTTHSNGMPAIRFPDGTAFHVGTYAVSWA